MIRYLENRGFKVFQISRKGKNLFAPWLKTQSFREVMTVLYSSSLFIGLDSGPSHIASVMGIPSLIFFGSVNPLYRHLNDHNKIFLQTHCSQGYCYHEISNTFGQPCRLVEENKPPPCCIHDEKKVIQAIDKLLKLTKK